MALDPGKSDVVVFCMQPQHSPGVEFVDQQLECEVEAVVGVTGLGELGTVAPFAPAGSDLFFGVKHVLCDVGMHPFWNPGPGGATAWSATLEDIRSDDAAMVALDTGKSNIVLIV